MARWVKDKFGHASRSLDLAYGPYLNWWEEPRRMRPNIKKGDESSYAQDILESIFDRPQCEWCKDPNVRVFRKSLCSHCYRLSRNLIQTERKVNQAQGENREFSFELDLEFLTANEAIADAKRDGIRYGNLQERSLDGITLEYEFAFLSKILTGENLYHGTANLFDYCLSIPQKRFVLYMLSEMGRIHRKRSRKSRAKGNVIMGRLKNG